VTYEAKAQMVIRRPVAEVFEAFVDPDITTKFWFTKSSGKLVPGERVRWTWEMYDAHADVLVKEIEQNERILVEWDGYGTTPIEWTFTGRADGTTFVEITNSGIDTVQNALDSSGGFDLLLAGAKIYLEHGIEPNLVADHMP